MRVISGTARGKKLKSVPGSGTRPITDRVKVALFDLLAGDVHDSIVLDLFAGTGGVGIEALSRGARKAVFVDLDPAAIKTIRENLKNTRLDDRAAVVRSDAFRFLDRAEHETFHWIYIAPPQYQGLWIRALQAVDDRSEWLADDGLVVVQIDPKEKQPVSLRHLEECDQRRYGSTLLWFFERPGN